MVRLLLLVLATAPALVLAGPAARDSPYGGSFAGGIHGAGSGLRGAGINDPESSEDGIEPDEGRLKSGGAVAVVLPEVTTGAPTAESAVDFEVRAAEREQVLVARESALEVRERDLELRERALEAREARLEAREKKLETREKAVEVREKQVGERTQALHRQVNSPPVKAATNHPEAKEDSPPKQPEEELTGEEKVKEKID